MNTNAYLINYSEKCVAVFGNTKPIKEDLKRLGGRFNYHLVDPANKEEKIPGWVFPMTHKEQVSAFLLNTPIKEDKVEYDVWGDEIHQEDGEEYFKCAGTCNRVFYFENTNEDGMCGTCEHQSSKKKRKTTKK